MPVRSRILYVNVIVRDIEVSADDNAFLFREPAHVRAEVILPFHSVSQALKLVLRVRNIDADKIKIIEFHRDDTPLMVMLVNTDVIRYGKRLYTCIYGSSGITFLVGVIPI